jgi:hypothetical protein
VYLFFLVPSLFEEKSDGAERARERERGTQGDRGHETKEGPQKKLYYNLLLNFRFGRGAEQERGRTAEEEQEGTKRFEQELHHTSSQPLNSQLSQQFLEIIPLCYLTEISVV